MQVDELDMVLLNAVTKDNVRVSYHHKYNLALSAGHGIPSLIFTHHQPLLTTLNGPSSLDLSTPAAGVFERAAGWNHFHSMQGS